MRYILYWIWIQKFKDCDDFLRYLRLEIPEDLEIEGMSSTKRLSRVNKCMPPENRENIISLMSNTQDKDYPFFRDGCEPDPIYTVTVGK